MAEVEISFTEREVAQVLWALSEATDLAETADALSTLAFLRRRCGWSVTASTADNRIDAGITLRGMADRVKVTEAVRMTGVPGTAIFLAIRHGEISSERDERGYDWVDPDEVASLAVTH